MKSKVAIILLVMFNMLSTQAQECLQNALNRYDYSDAIHIIDSLMATDKADSVGLALHKARCLKKLYRAEEAAETIAEVLHIDQFNVELMAELAECHMQAGNTEEASTYIHCCQECNLTMYISKYARHGYYIVKNNIGRV